MTPSPSRGGHAVVEDDAGVASNRTIDSRGFVFVAFLVLLAVTIARHEMWRDEVQAWMIARSSHSIGDVLHNIRYEGHPALWYLVLFPISKLNRSPETMQVLQFVIAVANVGLVLKYAPFSKLQKALFCGGYYVIFDYGTISRNYSLGFLFVTITCVIASSRHRWPWCGLPLALLACTSAFSSFVAVGLLLGLIVDEVVRHRRDEGAAPLSRVVVAGALTFVALAAAYAEASPRGDAGTYRAWKLSFDSGLAGSSVSAVTRALAPLPKLQRAFWSTSLFDGHTASVAVVGVLLFAGIAWSLHRSPGACVIWVSICAFVVLFLYSKIQYGNASRYNGHIFLGLMAALWLAPTMARIGNAETDVRARRLLWTAILVLQLIAGMFAVGTDIRYPFSDGRRVAGYIDRHDLSGAVIIGVPDRTTLTVAAYLDRDLYYPNGRRFGQYIVWNEARGNSVDTLGQAVDRFAKSVRPVLVVSDRALAFASPGVRLRLLTSEPRPIVPDERYWLYQVEYLVR
jgi:hypothetical protein